jgi:hypothetical protein
MRHPQCCMAADRTVIVDLDRSYDLRVLEALPSTLAMFAASDLEIQLEHMARERRAICFTLMAPVRSLGARPGLRSRSIATVLVCLHVAPELAGRGVAPLMATLKRAAALDTDPVHELGAPLTRPGHAQSTGFYREAVYGDEDAYVAITTHTPADIPAEAEAAVAAATRGTPVDIVTTVAVTPYRPAAAQAVRLRRPPTRPTLH